MLPRPRISTLFPYTTLFRSRVADHFERARHGAAAVAERCANQRDDTAMSLDGDVAHRSQLPHELLESAGVVLCDRYGDFVGGVDVHRNPVPLERAEQLPEQSLG